MQLSEGGLCDPVQSVQIGLKLKVINNSISMSYKRGRSLCSLTFLNHFAFNLMHYQVLGKQGQKVVHKNAS